MNKLSLFSGIGGDDLASEWAGIKTICFVEKDKYCQKVLKKHWPEIPLIEDVKDVTKEKVLAYARLLGQAKFQEQATGIEQHSETLADTEGRQPGEQTERQRREDISRGSQEYGIDIISGGFPCQPHSVAGKRKGSGDERNLWPEFRRIVSEIRPRWVVAENVPGLFSSDDGYFFGEVIADLASLGYVVGWCCYGAVDVGAPHRRDRVFIVAYSGGLEPRRLSSIERTENIKTQGSCQTMAYSPIKGLEGAITEGTASATGQPEQCGDVCNPEHEQFNGRGRTRGWRAEPPDASWWAVEPQRG